MRRRSGLVLLGALASARAWAGLEQTIDAAKPSLVAVGTYDPLSSPRFQFRGTGFVIGDGRHVVTCAHVLAKQPGNDTALQWMLYLPKGRQPPELRPAKVLGTDVEHDLAVLSLDGEPLPALRLAAPGVAREGRDVAVFGFPLGSVLGLAPVTHRGIISAIAPLVVPAPTARQIDPRAVMSLRQGSFDILQLDATAYPGNSGGPVVDVASGQVVGVVNMVRTKGTRESAISQPTGITYAIPVDLLAPLLDAPKDAGATVRTN